jgi:UDP-2,4-diacetamido-2,4,6-trideoxy-beta-L-altropyranose hydrolase
MRVASLARQMAQDGFRCGFAVSPETARRAGGMLAPLGEIRVLTAPDSPAHLRRLWPAGCDWLVVDHYGLADDFERACAGWAARIAVFDDAPTRRHACDVLIDGTVDRDGELYRPLVSATARCLCGASYLPMRPDFFRLRSSGALEGRFAVAPGGRRLFVSLGGGDTLEPLTRLLDILVRARFPWPVDVCTMAGGTAAERLRLLIARLAPTSLLHLSSTAVAPLLAAAWAALGAGGTASCERAALGLPSAIVEIAANQRDTAAAFAHRNAACTLGPVDAVEAETLVDVLMRLFHDGPLHRAISANALRITDALGACRLVLELAPERDEKRRAVSLRAASAGDCDMILRWQSEPGARRFARNPAVPTEGEHRAWFCRTLGEPQSLLNVIVADERPVGVLRFDRRGGNDDWEISILVAGEARSCGVGRAALAAGRRLLPDADLVAEIHPDNAASLRLFRAVGYRSSGVLFVNAAQARSGAVPGAYAEPDAGAAPTRSSHESHPANA